MEIEGFRGNGVTPVTRVWERERAEASLVPDNSGGEELGVGKRVDLGGEGVLRKVWRKKV